MNEEKKAIDEMAEVIKHTERLALDVVGAYPSPRMMATDLYNKGYRKQSEGEWIQKHRHRGGFRTVTVTDSLGEKHTGMVDDRYECDDLYCSVCGKISHDAFLNYCANCGAKMKGK